MNRTDVIQKIINAKKARSYLEIGAASGENFFRIKARRKIAVEPNLNLLKKQKMKWNLLNVYNLSALYHESCSDDYFESIESNNDLDVVFIDGLHTYEQSLRDVIHSLNNLNDNGVIVLHDCNPPNEAAAYPAESNSQAAEAKLPGWTGEWCGDVWKTICFLRSQKMGLNVFVLDCDYGLGIVTKGTADSCLTISEEELNNMSHEDLLKDKKNLLNLKEENYLFEFLDRLR